MNRGSAWWVVASACGAWSPAPHADPIPSADYVNTGKP